MSLRYTGEATMDEPALRDVERWKDKIEVRLDNRQVFFLFFGSAMVACMLFVLGVIVGKRLETRGRAEAPAIEDPLAVLDRFGVATVPAPAPAALTFPRALIGGGTVSPASPPKTKALATSTLASTAPIATPVAIPAAPVPEPVAVVPAAAPITKKVAAVPRPLSPMIPVVRVRQQVGPAPTMAAAPATAPPPAIAAVSPSVAPRVPAAVRAPSSVRTPTKEPTKEPTQPVKLATPSAPKTAAAPAETKAKGRFLLQLSSFQDRGEADTFARRFAGQSAYVVATEIPGKGTWYRVRVGSYGSMQEATVAKTTFERDHNVIAYVAGGGPAK